MGTSFPGDIPRRCMSGVDTSAETLNPNKVIFTKALGWMKRYQYLKCIRCIRTFSFKKKLHRGSTYSERRTTILEPGRGELHAELHVRPISCHVVSLSWQEPEEEIEETSSDKGL